MSHLIKIYAVNKFSYFVSGSLRGKGEIAGVNSKNDLTQRLHYRDVRFKDQRTNRRLWILWGSQSHTEALVLELKERKKRKKNKT